MPAPDPRRSAEMPFAFAAPPTADAVADTAAGRPPFFAPRLMSVLFVMLITAAPAFGGDFPHAGLPAEQAAAAMRLPAGFRVIPFAAEPDVTQPIAMAIDHRGRLWVAEGHSYPVKRADGEGRDRILIFEDTDGDGRHDVRKVFAEGLNLVSGLEVGFGGAFVGQAPQLLFIPDADGDDVPDGPPVTLLDGWGYEDTHETLNSFVWGPDGWLYGCHGVFTHSRVGPPGTPDERRVPINAGVWRYHPTTRAFETFALGTSNPWGVDFDERGQAFETACVIPHLYHLIPGGRYFRQAGRHFDPHVYEDIPTIAKHRHFVGYQWDGADRTASLDLGGGHAHAGALIYQGDAWPAEYRGRLLMNNIHGARLNADSLTPAGSGFVGDRLPDFCLTDDEASQMIYLRGGPDGNVFVIDWYDTTQCHSTKLEDHDRANGRIWKIVYEGENPPKPRSGRTSALGELTTDGLVALLTHPNVWHRRHASRLLQERDDPAAFGPLDGLARSGDALTRLRGLWALAATGLLTGDQLDAALSDGDGDVRAWAVRLLGQSRPALPMSGGTPRSVGELPKLPAFGDRLETVERMARTDPAAKVRLELAALAQRLPVGERWGVLAGLLSHGEDADDHNLPLMAWFAFEPLVPADPDRALAAALAGKIPTVRRLALRRVGEIGTPAAFAALAETAAIIAERGETAAAVEALEALAAALAGRGPLRAPAWWAARSDRLWATDAVGSDLKGRLFKPDIDLPLWRMILLEHRLGTRRGGLLPTVMMSPAPDAALRPELRREGLAMWAEDAGPKFPAALQVLIDRHVEEPFAADAVRELGKFDRGYVPEFLMKRYGRFHPDARRAAVAVLAARPAWAEDLLDAVAAGNVPAAELTADLARQVRGHSPTLAARLAAVWGTVAETDAERQAQIDRLKKKLRSQDNAVSAEPDRAAGRDLFKKTCGQCHELFGEGGDVGPGLTGSNRRDLDYLLTNILDPSAVLAKDYRPTVLLTDDGRVVTGLVRSETDAAILLATADGDVTVPAAAVVDRTVGETSMMPEGLLNPLSTEQVRDLVGYLRGEGR